MSSEEAVRADAMETVVEVRARGVESDDAGSSEGDARDGNGDDARARVRAGSGVTDGRTRRAV